MRWDIRRVVAFLLLLALSVGFGFAFDAAATAIERRNHPRPEALAKPIAAYAEEFGIPETILWAVAYQSSGFASNAVAEDGAVGLMQLTPEQFTFITQEILGEQTHDTGLLYDPDTNLRCGAAWLSYLYEHYSVWDLTFAAYRVGTETVDAWLTDPDYTDEEGRLTEIPDRKVASYVKQMEQAVEAYRTLYYEP